MDLTCPKCHGTMRTYERNGVHVDQCTDCRGIFLDRGELDRLVDAENAWHGGGAKPAERHEERHEERYEERRGDEYRREQEPSHGHASGQQAASGAGLGAVVGEVLRQVQGSKSHSSHSSDPYYKKRKKESFLGDLFG
jgi:Zn-finger nucleic acid-binding protein